jgi:Domain of unknown function (DUF4833)
VLRQVPLGSAALACLAFGLVALVAPAARGDGAARDVASVFHVAKSENKNQVHYGIHLDGDCAPVGPEPVFAYWRMLEHGPTATEPLLSREVRAYGFASQRVLDRGPAGGRVLVTLYALPGKPIVISSSPSADGSCTAVAVTTVDRTPAALTSVFVQLRWPFGVSYLRIAARALVDGRKLEETVTD